MKITIAENVNKRIDVYLTEQLEMTRSKIQKLIHEEKIKVGNKLVNASYILKKDDQIDIDDIDSAPIIDISPEKMDLNIVYEDDYLLVINKQSGVVVHPAIGNYEHTMVNGLLYYFNDDNEDNNIRPGIVHRLDKDTSGLMLVAKDDQTQAKLSEMIKNKEVERQYIALVWGIVKHEKGTIDAPIGRDIKDRQKYAVTSFNSKNAITHFKTIERLNNTTLVECKLDTGRTHQIRVHMNYIGHPIVNDPLYGNRKIIDKEFGQMLHSTYIRFVHPVTKKVLEFKVDPPQEFINIVNQFRDLKEK